MDYTEKQIHEKLGVKLQNVGIGMREGQREVKEEVQFLALFPSGSSVSSRVVPLPGSSPRGRQGWCVNPGSGSWWGRRAPRLLSFPGVLPWGSSPAAPRVL